MSSCSATTELRTRMAEPTPQYSRAALIHNEICGSCLVFIFAEEAPGPSNMAFHDMFDVATDKIRRHERA